jgi:hypothetical protein
MNVLTEFETRFRAFETRLRVVEVRSLYNQRICWVLIATDLVLHALRFF